MRNYWIIGNWKMEMGKQQGDLFVSYLLQKIQNLTFDMKFCIGIAPSFPSIPTIYGLAKGSALKIGAQDVSPFSKGSYTGEVSSTLLKEVGAQFVIIGHSERRTHFFEGDEVIHQKLRRVIEKELVPVLCIGETKEERDQGKAHEVLNHQLSAAIQNFSKEEVKDLVIAYEPVWAIGTGETATSDEVQKTHHWMRHWIHTRWGQITAETLPIVYGGSVKPENVRCLIEKPDVDGVLVGGASLKVDTFFDLIQKAQEAIL